MIATTLRKNLVTLATTYAKATGSSIDQVSKRFYGNGTFLREFRAGDRSISIDKFDEVTQAFRAKWPKGATWPLLRAAIIKHRRARG